ncbi:MAG: TRAP transporter large permease [Deltaproteobacteria bacterium]|nr:TRAP transporter large permease [Deltaproteobacteria bacterium]
MDHSSWIAIWTFLGMFALLVLGVPIFICMLAAAFVGSMLIGGPVFTLQTFASAPYSISSTYTFAVVPLFLLMSVLAANCGLAQAAFDAASKWIGRIRGGLLMATIGSAAVFGATCGASIASAAVFSKIALPELLKYKYEKKTSMGCISVAGNLASLIPPSVGIIIISILADASIGRALVAGIIPGIVLAVLLMSMVGFRSIIKPQDIPHLDIQATWGEKFASLKMLGPVLFVVAIVIGGMFFGVFPPTVGGAIGSVGVLIVAAINRVGWKVIRESLVETVIMNAQIFILIISGYIFSRFIALSGLPEDLLGLITAANMSKYLLMLIIIIFYMFIGCVLEFMSMAIITVPLVYPLLTAAGFDPLATIVILVLLSEIALVTPPIGMSCYIVAGIAKVPPEEVFKGILPYFSMSILLLALLIFFPQISTWLPNLFYGQSPV